MPSIQMQNTFEMVNVNAFIPSQDAYSKQKLILAKVIYDPPFQR
jgi:hypothetical protein